MADEGRKENAEKERSKPYEKFIQEDWCVVSGSSYGTGNGIYSIRSSRACKITVNNLDEHATITNVQIIEPDQTTETGWKFSNGAEASFKKVSDWKNLTDQQILWKLIKYANENASVPEGTVKADVADFQAAMGFVEKELASSYTSENVAANVITATKAGVYAIKATTTDHKNYVYSPMAAFVSFGTYTTEPTSLVGVTVNAKEQLLKLIRKPKTRMAL